MTWSIYAKGTPKQVKEISERTNVYGQAGGEATKALVAAVCDSFPAELSGSVEVDLKASGHSDTAHHSVNIDLKAEQK